MKFYKPKFWDYKKPNLFAYLLLPLTFPLLINNLLRNIIKPKKISNVTKICIGNIYIGGTGKTPLAIKLNNLLNYENMKSVIVKKFYKNQIDEQKLLEKNGKLFLSNKRVNAIKQAENEDYQFAVLDDGLQDRSINYDVSFVCFNNINWIGNGMTIPSGPLREPLNSLKKHKNVFINGNLENIENLKKEIFKVNPKINIHIGKYQPINLDEFDKDNKYIAFSGIGNHHTFISMLKINGIKIVKELEFPDHYEYSEKDINQILSEANKLNSKILTTEKDYLRIKSENLSQIKYIKSELKIMNEDEFFKSLI